MKQDAKFIDYVSWCLLPVKTVPSLVPAASSEGKWFSAPCPHCQVPGTPWLGQGSSATLVAVLCSTPSPRAQFRHNGRD